VAWFCSAVDTSSRPTWTRRSGCPASSPVARTICEYLAALDTSRADDESTGVDDGNSSGTRSKHPKEVSLTDPQAAWVARKGVDPFFAYDANYVIDNKTGIIVDAEGTRANRIAEIAVTESMVDRVARRFNLHPQRLAGDSVYGAVGVLKALMDRNIAPLFQYGINRRALTALSAGLTVSTTRNATATFVQAEQSSPAPAPLIKATSSTTGPTIKIVRPVR
jgi:hypothetical protein